MKLQHFSVVAQCDGVPWENSTVPSRLFHPGPKNADTGLQPFMKGIAASSFLQMESFKFIAFDKFGVNLKISSSFPTS
jgi:hypothetical protein